MVASKTPTATPSSTLISPEDARKVMWLRYNRRPLGELLDEGYLDESRLAWAAANAYDPKLKQAAAVLRDELRRSPKATVGLFQRRGEASPSSLARHRFDGDASPLPAELPLLGNAPVTARNGTPLVEAKHPATSVQVGITLENARATLWPFAPYKSQPMGPLSETHQLALKDLGYAIDNAWDQRVRQAAMALLLMRLQQAIQEPPAAAGHLKVVSGGESYAQRQQYKLALAEGCLMGAILGAGLVLTIEWLNRLTTGQMTKPLSTLLSSSTGILILVIALAIVIGAGLLFARCLEKVTNYLDRQIENHRLGQEGEDRVAEIARLSLDGDWHLFRNVVLPGRNRADLDGVLVGPAGVWVLEVKTLTGEYRNTGDRWEVKRGSRWKAHRANPSRQAEDNAIRLANFLKADDIKQWVTPGVVWANPDSPLTVVNPAANVWPLDRLPDELGNLWHGQPIPEAKREAIVSKLSLLCQQRREEDANRRKS